jgi:hypothetical protein
MQSNLLSKQRNLHRNGFAAASLVGGMNRDYQLPDYE